ncbi:unnamed protein product [Linum trigynum]|uniref:Uncharacterized protein n=1 Tax=Linum trigynum TaxID=586398 RepID=A0AAV2DWQ0_9ROSI
MHLVVRYLHVPHCCSQCVEYGHCEGEGTKCKVVQINVGKDLFIAEAMTEEVAWVTKPLQAADVASSSSVSSDPVQEQAMVVTAPPVASSGPVAG